MKEDIEFALYGMASKLIVGAAAAAGVRHKF